MILTAIYISLFPESNYQFTFYLIIYSQELKVENSVLKCEKLSHEYYDLKVSNAIFYLIAMFIICLLRPAS